MQIKILLPFLFLIKLFAQDIYHISDLEGNADLLNNYDPPLEIIWNEDKQLQLKLRPGYENSRIVFNGDIIGSFPGKQGTSSIQLISAISDLQQSNPQNILLNLGNKDLYLVELVKYLIESETLRKYRRKPKSYEDMLIRKIDEWAETFALEADIDSLRGEIQKIYGIEDRKKQLVKLVDWLTDKKSTYLKFIENAEIMRGIDSFDNYVLAVHGGIDHYNFGLVPAYHDPKSKKLINQRERILDVDIWMEELEKYKKAQNYWYRKMIETNDPKFLNYVSLGAYGDSDWDVMAYKNFSNGMSVIYPYRPNDLNGNVSLPKEEVLKLLRNHAKKKGLKGEYIIAHGHTPSAMVELKDPKSKISFYYLDPTYQNAYDRQQYFVQFTEEGVKRSAPVGIRKKAQIKFTPFSKHKVTKDPQSWIGHGILYASEAEEKKLFHIQEVSNESGIIQLTLYRMGEGFKKVYKTVSINNNYVDDFIEKNIRPFSYQGSNEYNAAAKYLQEFFDSRFKNRLHQDINSILDNDPKLKKMTPLFVTGSSEGSMTGIENIKKLKQTINTMLDQCGSPPSCYIVAGASRNSVDALVLKAATMRGIPTVGLVTDQSRPKDILDLDYYIHAGETWDDFPKHYHELFKQSFAQAKDSPILFSSGGGPITKQILEAVQNTDIYLGEDKIVQAYLDSYNEGSSKEFLRNNLELDHYRLFTPGDNLRLKDKHAIQRKKINNKCSQLIRSLIFQ
ncbi:hypothetical protein N9N67_04450 [Bacteriovoracaceae bacterium]|nr:hypothetical protein [Bacteriovoracaceae bacterium]